MPRHRFVFNTLLEPSQNLLMGCTRHQGSAAAAHRQHGFAGGPCPGPLPYRDNVLGKV